MKPTVLEETWHKGSQSIEFTGIYKLVKLGLKIKTHIDRDSYDKQSSAVVSVWNKEKLEWNFLANIPYSLMEVCIEKVSYHSEIPKVKRYFEIDNQKLIAKAIQILE